MPDIFLRSGETAPSDIRLFNPTVPSSGGTTTLTADTVAFVEAATAATLLAKLLGSVGSLTVTGKPATLKALLVPAVSSYLEANPATTLKTTLSAGIGGYSQVGKTATLKAVLLSSTRAYALTGYSVPDLPGAASTPSSGFIANTGRMMIRRG